MFRLAMHRRPDSLITMQRVLILNGPNLNLLGRREPEVYGSMTLAELEASCVRWGAELGIEISTFQSNHEGALIDALHQSDVDGIVFNGGAFTHYAYALHDAIVAIDQPTVEVHLSNIKKRESWRRTSVTAPACVYSIYGRGAEGYRSALRHLHYRHASPATTVAYGADPDQVGDLRLPIGGGPYRVVVLIHGGFWRDHWTRDLMDGIAADLAARGFATWNIEYRRVGSGGGWPATLEDVSHAIDHLAVIAADRDLDLDDVTVIGHSAGGHLAHWAAGRPTLPAGAPGSKPVVVASRTIGLAPVFDLAAAHARNLGDGAVEEFLRRAPGDQRYELASPAQLQPLAGEQHIVHGTDDEAVPIDLSLGTGIPVVAVEGADHFAVIDPKHAAWHAVLDLLN